MQLSSIAVLSAFTAATLALLAAPAAPAAPAAARGRRTATQPASLSTLSVQLGASGGANLTTYETTGSVDNPIAPWYP